MEAHNGAVEAVWRPPPLLPLRLVPPCFSPSHYYAYPSSLCGGGGGCTFKTRIYSTSKHEISSRFSFFGSLLPSWIRIRIWIQPTKINAEPIGSTAPLLHCMVFLWTVFGMRKMRESFSWKTIPYTIRIYNEYLFISICKHPDPTPWMNRFESESAAPSEFYLISTPLKTHPLDAPKTPFLKILTSPSKFSSMSVFLFAARHC
jgi:hypothetical protein